MSAVASVAATFAAGVLSSATPCVFAAVPVTVGLVGSHARSTEEAVRLSLAFVLGMTLSFATLGLLAARLGLFIGIVDPFWGALVGAAIAGAGLWLFLREEGIRHRSAARMATTLSRLGMDGRRRARRTRGNRHEPLRHACAGGCACCRWNRRAPRGLRLARRGHAPGLRAWSQCAAPCRRHRARAGAATLISRRRRQALATGAARLCGRHGAGGRMARNLEHAVIKTR